MDASRFPFRKEPDAHGCVPIAPTSLEPIITILRMVFVRIRLEGVREILLRGRPIRAAQGTKVPRTPPFTRIYHYNPSFY
jgi:hypothetical protein